MPSKAENWHTLSYEQFFSKHRILDTVDVPLRGRTSLLLFDGVLFKQEIPKELILLCIDYVITLRLEKSESQK